MFKKWLVGILVTTMVLQPLSVVADTSVSTNAVIEDNVCAISGLSNPRIVPDSSMEAGQKVTYDCIWLGSYPQAEVIPDKSQYTAIGADYLENGDIIENASLYSQLQSATYNSKNETTIGGTRYRRMLKGDATHVKPSYGDYYNWSDSTTYHYFKYEPIKWRVIEKDSSSAFLLADKGLDDQRYNETHTDVTWETCTLRDYLNSTFYDNAFNTTEKRMIIKSTVENANNLYYGTSGGNNTSDNVFLLAENEVYKTGDGKSFTDSTAVVHGFVDSYGTYDEARRARSTVFSKAMGTRWDTSSSYKGNCSWWMRSPGYSSYSATLVIIYGDIHDSSRGIVNSYEYALRPALKIHLSSLTDSMYAGTVCSDGTVNETAKPGDGGGSVTPTPAGNTDGWVTLDGKPYGYLQNGVSLKNGEYELCFLYNNNYYIGNWCFDTNGKVVTGKKGEIFYNDGTYSDYPYGIRIDAANYKEKLKEKRASDILAGYNYTSTWAEDIDNDAKFLDSMKNYWNEGRALISTTWKYLSGKSTGSFSDFCSDVAYEYMNNPYRSRELLREIVEKRFGNAAADITDNTAYKITKFSADKLTDKFSSKLTSRLNEDKKLYTNNGKLDGNKYSESYIAILKKWGNSSDSSQVNSMIIGQVVSTVDELMSLSPELISCIKNYSQNIEYLETIKKCSPKGSTLYTAADDLISSYENRYWTSLVDSIITCVNIRNSWANMMKGTSIYDSIPTSTGYVDETAANVIHGVLKSADKPLKYIDQVLSAMCMTDSRIAATDSIVASSSMRADSIQALRNAETVILNGDTSYEAYVNYMNCFYLANDFYMIAYDSMGEYYKYWVNAKYTKEKADYCDNQYLKLYRLSRNPEKYIQYESDKFGEVVYYDSTKKFYDWNSNLIKDSWITYKGCKYYVGSEGTALDGFRELYGKYYYFSTGTGDCDANKDEKGVLQWGKRIILADGSTEYYANKEGVLARNTYICIDKFFGKNVYHYYGDDGKYQKEKSDKANTKVYFSYENMITTEDGYILDTNCPVDVYVYDTKGTELAKIINDSDISVNGAVANIDANGQKLIALKRGEDYNVKIVAREAGNMDCSSIILAQADGVYSEKIDYRDIALKKGDVFTGTISGDDFFLYKDDQQLYVTEIINEVNFYEVTVEASDNGSVTGGGMFIPGEFAKVTASPDEGYEFMGWFDFTDTCVSTDEVYRFAVLEQQTLMAKFAKTNNAVKIGTTGYKVEYTPSVSYNGVSHIEKGGKASKTKTGDIEITLYDPSGKVISPDRYKVSFKNNKNAYDAKNRRPYFNIKLKDKVDKSIKAAFKATNMYFEIKPCDISSLKLSSGTLKETKNGYKLSNLSYISVSGKTIKLKQANKGKGDFTIEADGSGKYRLKGIGNYSGTYIYKN